MKFDVSNKNNYFYFLVLLSVYFLYYSLAEFKYISFVYSTPLNVFDKFNCNFLILKILENIKNNLLLIKGLYVLKIIALPLLLVAKTRRASAILLLLISLILTTISSSSSPELRYLNFLLMIVILYPKYFNKDSSTPSFSPVFDFSLWMIFGISYFIAGYFKWISPEWFHGTFMSSFVESNHNFNTRFLFLLNYPIVLTLGTHFAMWAELLALPLSLFRKTRFMALFNLTLMQLGLLVLADIYQITLGMLLFHLFLALNLTNKKFSTVFKR